MLQAGPGGERVAAPIQVKYVTRADITGQTLQAEITRTGTHADAWRKATGLQAVYFVYLIVGEMRDSISQHQGVLYEPAARSQVVGDATCRLQIPAQLGFILLSDQQVASLMGAGLVSAFKNLAAAQGASQKNEEAAKLLDALRKA